MQVSLAPARKFALGFGVTVLLSLTGCGGDGDEDEKTSATFGQEPTPEEMAEELGVPNEPGSRTVKPSDFGRYPLVVDVFRKSAELPVLGPFESRYVDLLTSPNSGTPAERLARAQSEFKNLAGREFAVISVGGTVRKAYIISGGLEAYAQGGMRRTPPGSYKLDVIRYAKKIPQADGSIAIDDVDYPWLRSQKYGNSIMYWGLWIFGGYFIHSTTHYGQLGTPASMGCIRQAYPDAIELFKLRQNNLGLIRIHLVGSRQAFDRLRELTTPDGAVVALAAHRKKIENYIDYAGRSEIAVLGHAWVEPSTGKPGRVSWPDCGPVDCFKIWGKSKPIDPSAALLSAAE